jgi:predicted nucleotidyltransferase
MAHDALTAQEVADRLALAAPSLRARYGLTGLWLFGSVGRGDARPDSDVDLLARFERPVDLFRLDELERELATLLGRRVDLAEPDALHPALRDGILAEARLVA